LAVRCAGIKRDGGRCTTIVKPPQTHCYQHDPERAGERKRNASRAAVASQVLNVYLRAVSVELKIREQQEITERLEELETLLEQQKGERRYGA
jgi:hypothetical protein